MKKLLLFTVAFLTSFYAFSQMIDAKTIEELEKVYSSITNPSKFDNKTYQLCKKFLGTDFSKTSYDEAKNLFEKTDKEDGKKIFFRYVLFSNRLKHFQKDAVTKDGNEWYIICFYPIHIPDKSIKSVYENIETYNKALMKAIKYNAQYNNLSSIKLGLKKFEKIQDELKYDEIKSSLKYMKRYIYPKINQGDEWKQLSVKIELMLKSLE